MKKFIYQIISAGHHGKGSKYTRKGNFELALSHFQNALKYSRLLDDEGTVALEMECVARTFIRLEDYDQAKKYAEESLSLYKKLQGYGHSYEEGFIRVTDLIKIMERRESI